MTGVAAFVGVAGGAVRVGRGGLRHGHDRGIELGRNRAAEILRETQRFDEAWNAFAEMQLQHPTSPLADRALFYAAEILSDLHAHLAARFAEFEAGS